MRPNDDNIYLDYFVHAEPALVSRSTLPGICAALLLLPVFLPSLSSATPQSQSQPKTFEGLSSGRLDANIFPAEHI
jgi:hypothetical protein